MKSKNLIFALLTALAGFMSAYYIYSPPAETQAGTITEKALEHTPVATDSTVVLQKDAIIADLQRTITELSTTTVESEATVARLRRSIRRAKADAEDTGKNLERVTLLYTELKANPTPPVEVVELLDQPDVTHYALWKDPDGWLEVSVELDLAKDTARFNVNAHDEYTWSEWREGDVQKVKVESLNPYTSIREGSNVFIIPPDQVAAPAETKCSIWDVIGRLFKKKAQK